MPAKIPDDPLPTDKVIAGGADVLAFLAYWSGLKVGG